MTSEALTESIISLSKRHGIDPRPSLSASDAALSLRRRLNEKDMVIWPQDQGGLAWEAADKGKRPTHDGEDGRVFCVTFDGFPTTPELWKRLDGEAAQGNRRIIRVLLASRMTTRSEDVSRYPKVIEKLLGRFFPATSNPPITDGAVFGEFPDENAPLPAFSPIGPWPEIDQPSKRFRWGFPSNYGSWTHADAIYLDGSLDLKERFLAADVVVALGMIPFVLVSGDEAANAAAMARESGISQMVFLSEGDESVTASLRGSLSIPVLSPANETDMSGAFDWIMDQDAFSLVLHPGTGALPARASLKTPWEIGTGVVVKESNGGGAGRILFIVPGIMAKEAVKAADRMIKDNFSVTVLSMRFIHPVDESALRRNAAGFDLVLIVDSSGEAKGLGWSAGLPLVEDRSIHAVVVDSGHDGKSLAELAAGIHRENRFRRTVDDVKQDRW